MPPFLQKVQVLLVAAVATSLSLILPQLATAKSYSVAPVAIQASLYPDGSMSVEETRNYTFVEDFTFAYLEILRNPDQTTNPGRTEAYNLSNFTLCSETVCSKKLTDAQIASADEARPENTFYVLENPSAYYIKWFYRAADETRPFTLSYTVDNAITLHQDTAELY